MLAPSADTFAALARSSPWRWSTLRFSVRWRRGGRWSAPVHAWLRRPDDLRVEDDAGRVLQAGSERPRRPGRSGRGIGRTVPLPWAVEEPAPRLRPDGLVAERPRGPCYDDPMHENYTWVAMLDPVELADGRLPDPGGTPGVPLSVGSVRAVEHAGRPAWEALVAPTPDYEPRCGRCPLLRSREVDVAEYGEAGVLPGAQYPTGHLVRLDVATGVCVWAEALDGTWAGDGHELRIEAVDERMAGALFRRPRWR